AIFNRMVRLDKNSETYFCAKLTSMKYLYTLLSLLITCSLFGQTNYKPVEDIIRKYSNYWLVPQSINEFHGRGAITHTLDSIVGKNASSFVIDKAEMDYDAEGKTTEMRQYGLDSLTSTLQLEGVATFEYLTSGALSNLYFEELNTETQELVPFVEMNFFYDGSGRLDSTIISLEDPLFGGGFGPFLSMKQVYNGDLLVQTRQWIYISLLGGWIPASITDTEYDANDNIIQQLTSSVDFASGEVEPSDLTTYSYNDDGLKDTVINYYWEDPNWINSTLTTYTYHDNGTLYKTTEHVFSNGEWINSTLTTNPVEVVTEEFPFTNYQWDPVTSVWIPIDSTINLLNPALPWANVAAPSQLAALGLAGGDVEVNLPDLNGPSIDEIQYFAANPTTQEFEFQTRDIYYYSQIEGSSVNPVLPEYLTVTPNPAQDQFFIELDSDAKANYTVYTNTGGVVVKGDMREGKTSVQTSGWSTGMYYVVIRMQDGATYVHKQIVE
ncbi:MAG TPA: T9SS type A sorting domain-containing protein, partial [Saprospiraceae bacterium]